MKKNVKILLALLVAAVTGVLIAVNRNSVKKQEEMANAKQLQIVVNSKETIYYYNENDPAFTSFDTQMKRRNGDVFDKNYSGIQVKDIFDEMNITINENTVVSAVCADQYSVDFTYDEIMAEGNIYLITMENGSPLPEDSGSFMLVVNRDEFSTRWAKNTVQVKVSEKQN